MTIIRTFGICGLAAALLLGGAVSASAAVYSPEGRPLIEAFDAAGSGEYEEWNGAAAEAAFRHPGAVLPLADGSVLVSDTDNQRIRILENGSVQVYAGTEYAVLFGDDGLPTGAYADGQAEASFFSSPMGMAADAEGNVYVADRGNHAIRRISADGIVSTVAGNGVLGNEDGQGKGASLYAPSDVAVDASGNIYVADTLNHAIRKIDAAGNVTTLNAPSERVAELLGGIVEPTGDYRDGPIAEALFNEPSGLALDAKGNLYVSDTGNQRIRYIDFEAGTVTTAAGGGDLADGKLYAEGAYADGPAAAARFNSPHGLAIDAEGGLYIADSLNHSVRYLKDGQVTTVVGNASEYGSANGVDEQAGLYLPSDVAIDQDGDLYVADTFNNKVRKVEFYELPNGWKANGEIRVLHNEQEIKLDTQPELRNGRTMLPVRAVAEALGYTVSFEGANVILKGADSTISLTVGSQEVTQIAGEAATTAKMDVAPYVNGGRTYVPIRFIAEQMGIAVGWHAETATVLLRD
ncbi:stalk domain-containing protein [Cohnella lubricantis]|uniref:Copper amine oxidase n=1 Tax=Cohnella lubricantis TaxID=2163172 RepID=A0A841TE94_9BACL|nr:stalk domain-containing protein [Cohnella lubricantis]MBB6676771.1 copper amine oxidase [Cohnella lubricantis]MBP2117817.1 sugar lactone lactonase YvrE [Cohnella lubricantis]